MKDFGLEQLAQILGSLVVVCLIGFGYKYRGIFASLFVRQPQRRGAGASAAAPSDTYGYAGAAIAEESPRASWVRASQVAAADNVLVVGPKGSGKTTLIRSMVMHRGGDHIALDPHNSPGKWPCKSIGGGRDYHAIDLALDSLHAEMDYRFKQLAAGAQREGEFPRRTLVGDEFRSIAKEIKELNRQREKEDRGVDASNRLLARISEGRKVGECALVAAHADTVKALGIEGEGDLRMCFDWIVYLGALAVKRLPESAQMSRPAVAYHADRDVFYLLDFDIPVIEEGQQVPSVSSVSEPARPTPDADRLLRQSLGVAPQAAGTVVNSAGNRPEISEGAEMGFQALESGFTISQGQFSTAEIARITAMIIAGNGKTETVRAMPRYSGRRHAEYAAVYDEIRAALENA